MHSLTTGRYTPSLAPTADPESAWGRSAGLIADHASICAIVAICIGIAVTGPENVARAAPLAEKYLKNGQFSEGERALQLHLQSNAKDDEARFGLGMIQFVSAVENLGQNLFRYGLRNTDRSIGSMLPILRFPLPENLAPEKLTYEASRDVLLTLVADLTKAEATLVQVSSQDVKLRLPVGEIALRLAPGDKGSSSLGELLRQLRITSPALDEGLVIAWDRADVCWLRGYCHFLLGFSEFVLAHDTHELFDRTAQIFFPTADVPFEFLKQSRRVFDPGIGVDLADIIAFFHLLRFPVRDEERLRNSLAHWRSTLSLSREMWKYAAAETDDDAEWIPNPRQRGAMRIPVTQAMIDAWLGFVTESEHVLDGRRLVPFWRGDDRSVGVNAHKVFTEPREFDLILWIQGTAAAPYLERGELTDIRIWQGLRQAFGGQFFGFAAWFN